MEARSDGKSLRRLTLACVLAIPALYVLSIGPMYRVLNSRIPVWRTIYSPLFAIACRPQIGKTLASYLNVWTDKSYRATFDPVDGIGFLDDFKIE